MLGVQNGSLSFCAQRRRTSHAHVTRPNFSRLLGPNISGQLLILGALLLYLYLALEMLHAENRVTACSTMKNATHLKFGDKIR
jgi:hypothetical protein